MELQSIKQRFGIIGNAPVLNNALDVAIRVAPTNLSVLITGESGVGKEVFSQIIHQLSPRKHEGFIAVNCGAIPEGTIDSELFGHEKGSFTGAQDKRKGYFETVNGGTIFLDEIGEMPFGTQARLLRVLESGEFIKVGSSQVQRTDVRVLAATNVNLAKLVQDGKFREDLYYRLNTVPIYVPPLRERQDDILLLFRKFCVDFATKYRTTPINLDEGARELLLHYYWPGNVRELKNIAEQASVLSPDKTVTRGALAKFLPAAGQSTLPVKLVTDSEEKGFSDREIMYKLLFDMRQDINDLKKFIWTMAQSGKIDMADFPSIPALTPEPSMKPVHETVTSPRVSTPEAHVSQGAFVLDNADQYEEESVEESLSLVDMERDMILKALDKHKGRRRDAALELGISERTLYRKIKEYNIHA
jgi:transcriptional regulator with PAS, ATPase and Fis domain